jgi:hypothetical protein
MHLVVRESEGGLDGLCEWGAKESLAVVPAALMNRQRLHA